MENKLNYNNHTHILVRCKSNEEWENIMDFMITIDSTIESDLTDDSIEYNEYEENTVCIIHKHYTHLNESMRDYLLIDDINCPDVQTLHLDTPIIDYKTFIEYKGYPPSYNIENILENINVIESKLIYK